MFQISFEASEYFIVELVILMEASDPLSFEQVYVMEQVYVIDCVGGLVCLGFELLYWGCVHLSFQLVYV